MCVFSDNQMSEPPPKPPVQTLAFTLTRGMRVLVAMKETPEKIDGAGIIKKLRKRFPGVEFTILTGVEGIGIQNDR